MATTACGNALLRPLTSTVQPRAHSSLPPGCSRAAPCIHPSSLWCNRPQWVKFHTFTARSSISARHPRGGCCIIAPSTAHQALWAAVGVMGGVAHAAVRALLPIQSSELDTRLSRLIYETIAGRAAPVAICPQPVLSHSGFSHAPEKVSAPSPRRFVLGGCS